jgi:flagellar biosynthesis GTPase FlhF
MSTDSALLKASPQGFTPATPAAGGGEIRVYRGRSIDELIPRIEAELGSDAIVVRRKRGLEGGIGGFFQRPYIEVEAKPGTPRIDVYDEGEDEGEPAFPPPPGSTPEPAPASHSGAAPAVAWAEGAYQTPWPEGAYQTHTLATIGSASTAVAGEDSAQTMSFVPSVELAAPDEPVVEDPPLPSGDPRAAPDELTRETFASALLEAESTLTAPAPAPAVAVAQPASASIALSARSRVGIAERMIGAGVSEGLTEELIDSALAHVLPFAPTLGLSQAVHGALTARIPRLPLLPARGVTVAVIGPGGSGKTSCCAALLATYRRAGTLPASCATIMLAGEQDEPAVLLSPRIMEPTALASTRARRELEMASAAGLLLLDLPPLSPADRAGIRLMAGVLEELKPDRVLIALPATLGARAAGQLIESLRPLRAGAMAITHADETDQLGVAVEAACGYGLAPEYLLDRGRARGGLTRIDPTHLADRLLP